jgi:hypothetical protein
VSRRVRGLLAAAFALLLVAQTVRGWHRLQASVLVGLVQKQMAALSGAQLSGTESPRLVLAAADVALREAQRRDQAAVEPLAFHADLLFVGGRLADAEAAYRRAAAHEPRSETLFNWGMLLWRQGRTAEAAVQLRRALTLAPRLVHRLPPGSEAMVAATPLLTIPPLAPAPSPAPARP